MRSLVALLLLTTLFFACGRDTAGIEDGSTVTTTAAPAGAPVVPGEKLEREQEARPDMTGARQIGRDQMAPADDFRNSNGTADPEEARRMGPGTRPSSGTVTRASSQNGQVEATPKQFELTPEPVSVKGIEAAEVFTVSKTPCYGECQQYSFTLYTNGLVVLNAKKNMKREGLFATVPLGTDQTKLLADFRRATSAGLLTVYPEGEGVIADVPATILRYPGADGVRQSVRVYAEAPTALEELFFTVERIAKTGDWQRAEE